MANNNSSKSKTGNAKKTRQSRATKTKSTKQSRRSPKMKDIRDVIEALASDKMPCPEGQCTVSAPRKIALALSGGGAAGAVEAGVLEEFYEALDQHNEANPKKRIEIGAVLGTSTGSLNTYGLLLEYLRRRDVWKSPGWLEKISGRLVNSRVWQFVAGHPDAKSCVIDKGWLLTWLRQASLPRKILYGIFALIIALLLLLIPVSLIHLFGASPATIPDTAAAARTGSLATAHLGKAAAAGTPLLPLPAIIGGGLILTAAIFLFLLGKFLRPLALRPGHPLALSILIIFGNNILLGMAAGGIFSTLVSSSSPSGPGSETFLILSGLTLFLAAALSLRIFSWQFQHALFDNSRLLGLLAALGGSDTPHPGEPVSRKGAAQAAAEVSKNLCEAYTRAGRTKGKDSLPAFIFTAANITTSTQTLFLLGSPKDARTLQKKHWVAPLVGAPAQFRGWTAAGEDLLSTVLASTAIPGTYPPEQINIDYSDKKSLKRFQHTFVDGGVLDFVPYHAAIDLGCTHILSLETDTMSEPDPKPGKTRPLPGILATIYKTIMTTVSAEAREEAGRVAAINRLSCRKGRSQKTGKRCIRLIRIAPAPGERMINSEDFNGRFKKGTQVHTLQAWYNYGRSVSNRKRAEEGLLPEAIHWQDSTGEWQTTEKVRGPVIHEASFEALPERPLFH